MGFVEIDLRQGEVAFDHIQGGMTEHFLQGVGIAAIAQVLNGEGVAEAVRMHIGNARPFAEGGEKLGELAPIH